MVKSPPPACSGLGMLAPYGKPMNRKRLVSRETARNLLLGLIFALSCIMLHHLPAAADTRPGRSLSGVVEKDPNSPRGMRLRRARRANEKWPDYFCEVLLWPYTKEHGNRLFTTLRQNGRTVQFIPDVIFEVENEWILVLKGDKATCLLMGNNLSLEPRNERISLRPTHTTTVKCPREKSWVAFVRFAKPGKPFKRVMSSFLLFGNAGGVADVLTEEQVRQRYKVLRDIVDVIVEEILER